MPMSKGEKPSAHDTKIAAILTALIMLLKEKGIITEEESEKIHEEADFILAGLVMREDEKLK